MSGVPPHLGSTNSLSVRASENEAACGRCAQLEELLRQAEANIAELGQQLAGREVQLRRAGQAEVRLRSELEQRAEQDPSSKEVREVLAGWEARHPRAKTPMSGKRAKTVRNALKLGFSVEELKEALEGLAAFPFVGPHGRMATGTPEQRYDDVHHALADETTIDRFRKYATQGKQPARKAAPTGDPVERLLGVLEGVKPAGLNQWSARCPAHDDSHASLSVAAGRDGVVAHCHAGCSSEQVAAAAGVPLAEWFGEKPRPVAAPVPEALPSPDELRVFQQQLAGNARLLERLAEVRGWSRATLVALGVGWDPVARRLVLPVFDEHGRLVNVGRYASLSRPKMVALRGRPRNLFPAPESLAGRDVWLVEGEPDAITGRELGLMACGVPGVNGWRDEWAPRFAGRRVVVCMDCDEPWRRAAVRVAAALRKAGVFEVRVLDLDPTRGDGFDVSDFLLAGGSADGLAELVAACPVMFGDVAA